MAARRVFGQWRRRMRVKIGLLLGTITVVTAQVVYWAVGKPSGSTAVVGAFHVLLQGAVIGYGVGSFVTRPQAQRAPPGWLTKRLTRTRGFVRREWETISFLIRVLIAVSATSGRSVATAAGHGGTRWSALQILLLSWVPAVFICGLVLAMELALGALRWLRRLL